MVLYSNFLTRPILSTRSSRFHWTLGTSLTTHIDIHVVLANYPTVMKSEGGHIQYLEDGQDFI